LIYDHLGVRSLIYDSLSDTGNLSGDGTFTYQYNHRNRLVGVKRDAVSVADYGLNALLGQRVSKTVHGVTTHFHYGLDNKLLAESSGAGVISRSYLYLKIDATQGVDDIQEEINKMLACSPVEDSEEYAIHDYEGFGSYPLGEYEGLESAHEVACFIEEHSELGAELLAHFSSIDEARQAIEDNYCGCYSSLADYAQELTEQSTTIPENLTTSITNAWRVIWR